MADENIKVPVVQYVIMIYNIIEAFLAILFGLLSKSIALIGFGLDSIGESLTDLTVVRGINCPQNYSEPNNKKSNLLSPVLMAGLFFIFGSYVLYRAIRILMLREIPMPSLPGIWLAIISLLVIPMLALWGYKGPKNISKAFNLGFKDIWVYLILSFGLLLGLGLNYFYGWWQLDPIVALVTVFFLYKKSLDGLLAGEKSSNIPFPSNNQEE